MAGEIYRGREKMEKQREENGKGLRPHPSNLMLRVIKGPLKLRASTNYPHAVCMRHGLINIRLC